MGDRSISRNGSSGKEPRLPSRQMQAIKSWGCVLQSFRGSTHFQPAGLTARVAMDDACCWPAPSIEAQFDPRAGSAFDRSKAARLFGAQQRSNGNPLNMGCSTIQIFSCWVLVPCMATACLRVLSHDSVPFNSIQTSCATPTLALCAASLFKPTLVR